MHKKLITPILVFGLTFLAACTSAGTDTVRVIPGGSASMTASTTRITTTTSVTAHERGTLVTSAITTTSRRTRTATAWVGTESPPTTTRTLDKPVRWGVGFYRWPGLRVGDTFLDEEIIKANKTLRFIVLYSDNPNFKRRAKAQRNVRYVERGKKVSIPEPPHDSYTLLPYHDHERGDIVPAGPRWSFPNAGIAGDVTSGCVWLLDENDERHNVLWPKSYKARYDPVRIYDEGWTLVWEEDQRLDLDALPDRSAEYWERVPRECRVSDRDQDRPEQPVALILHDTLT